MPTRTCGVRSAPSQYLMPFSTKKRKESEDTNSRSDLCHTQALSLSLFASRPLRGCKARGGEAMWSHVGLAAPDRPSTPRDVRCADAEAMRLVQGWTRAAIVGSLTRWGARGDSKGSTGEEGAADATQQQAEADSPRAGSPHVSVEAMGTGVSTDGAGGAGSSRLGHLAPCCLGRRTMSVLNVTWSR